MKTGIDLLKEQNRSGKEWSEAFNRQLVENGEQPIDPETLLTWFCNAMMSMYDSINNNEIKELRKVYSIVQATLTALNVGDVASESLLHKELRKAMIDYRASN